MANKRDESKNAEVLGVYLEPTVAQSVRVGSLLRDPTGSVSFIVDESYIERGPGRPILSLAFHATSGEEDTIDRLRQRNDKMGRVTSLPPYFTNLLPEGALRSVVEAQLPPGDNNEFGMLRRLGGDLPGAVVIHDEGAATLPASRQIISSANHAARGSRLGEILAGRGADEILDDSGGRPAGDPGAWRRRACHREASK
jgi:HipA-like protein